MSTAFFFFCHFLARGKHSSLFCKIIIVVLKGKKCFCNSGLWSGWLAELESGAIEKQIDSMHS
jgi:hypothetical protein